MAASYEKGLILYRHRRYKDAAGHFARALREDDAADVDAHAMLALSLIGVGERERAEAAARAALALDADRAFAHYALAFVLLTFHPTRFHFGWRRLPKASVDEQRRQMEQSIAEARIAVSIEPDNADFHELVAIGETNLQRWRRGLEAAEAGLAASPAHEGCTRVRSLALRNLGEAERALDESRRGLHANPTHAALHAEAGWAALELGHTRAAIEHFESSLSADPTDAGPTFGLRLARWATRLPIVRLVIRVMLWADSGRRIPLMTAAVVTGVCAGFVRDGTDNEPFRMAAFILCFGPVAMLTLWAASRILRRVRRVGSI